MIKTIILGLSLFFGVFMLSGCSEEAPKKNDTPWYETSPKIEKFAKEHMVEIVSNRDAILRTMSSVQQEIKNLIKTEKELTDNRSKVTTTEKIRDLSSKSEYLENDIYAINKQLEQIYAEYIVSGYKALDKKVEELKTYADKTYMESLKIKKDIKDL